jgi:hypothetical protein
MPPVWSAGASEHGQDVCLTGVATRQHAVTAASSASMRGGLRQPRAARRTLMDYECRTVSSVATMSTLCPGSYLQSGYCHKIPDWPGRQPVQELKADVDTAELAADLAAALTLALCFVPARTPTPASTTKLVSEGGSTGSPEQLTPWAETA